MVDLATLTHETFAPHVGERFVLTPLDAGVPGSPVEVELAEAVSLGAPARSGRDPFSILFTGPGEGILPQGMYRLEHGALETIELFVVPLEPAGGRAQYQAIFT